MKKTHSILLLLVSVLVFGQNYKFSYEMKWKPTKKANEYQKELATLVVEENGTSIYQAYNGFVADSAKTKTAHEFIANGERGPFTLEYHGDVIFPQKIVKNPAQKKITMEQTLYINTYEIEETCPISWKIQGKTNEKILNLDTQTAKTSFGGRNWTAWYTTEIPIPEGPYKFYGLPGLILKIEDDTKEYSFEIKGIQKGNIDLSLRKYRDDKPIILTIDRWQKFYNQYKKEPAIVFKNLNVEKNQDWAYTYGQYEVDTKEAQDLYNKHSWEALKYFENPIETKTNCK